MRSLSQSARAAVCIQSPVCIPSPRREGLKAKGSNLPSQNCHELVPTTVLATQQGQLSLLVTLQNSSPFISLSQFWTNGGIENAVIPLVL